tara:strand:+ start:2519 stop:3787 length:1269 start_codon:yes stop_codon:yes gene_type:complete
MKGQVSGTALTARLLTKGYAKDNRVNTKRRNRVIIDISYEVPREAFLTGKVPSENFFILLDDTDIEVLYQILDYLPSIDIMSFASTSKSMFDMILLDKDILNHEFAQRFYLDRWFTILPRKIGLTLGECSFHPEEDVSHLTYSERCSKVFLNTVLYNHPNRGKMKRQLNCKELPPFFQTDFDCKLAFSHWDVCKEPYCDCGIAPWIFSERTGLECDCMLCSGHSRTSKAYSCLERIKELGCTYCKQPFKLGDVDESSGLDSTCDICYTHHQAGFRPNYRCMGDCLSDTDKWINYCEECWETFSPDTRDYGVEIYNDHGDIHLTFNDPAKDIFVKEDNLIKLFQKDRQFFALNNWFMLVNEMLYYVKTGKWRTKEFVELPPCIEEEFKDTIKYYEELDEECLEETPKDVFLYDFIEPALLRDD